MQCRTLEECEFSYTTRPALLLTDIGFVQKLNGAVREQVMTRARKGPLSSFSFEIGGVLGMDVRLLSPPAPAMSLDQSKLVVRPASISTTPSAKDSLFSLRLVYPDARYEDRINDLVGIGHIISQVKSAVLMFTTGSSEEWAAKFNPGLVPVLRRQIQDICSAVMLDGDPGVGKTELALCIGDWLARQTNQPVYLVKLDLNVRSGGHVGDITKRIGEAWNEVTADYASNQAPTILVIDEADAIAQSRGTDQQHHEDRAAVDALIQKMDQMRGCRIVTFYLTNFRQHIDPAVQRRVPFQFHLPRPGFKARSVMLNRLFGTVIQQAEISLIAKNTEGYTPADINRIFLDAISKAMVARSPLTLAIILSALKDVKPTASLEITPSGNNHYSH